MFLISFKKFKNLKVHKNENLVWIHFECFSISLIVMGK